MQETQVIYLGREDPPGEGKRHRLDPWVGKIPLEKEMATHYSILAWKTPGTKGAWQARVYGLQRRSTHKQKSKESQNACRSSNHRVAPQFILSP